MSHLALALILTLTTPSGAGADGPDELRLVTNPALSPDGSTLAFAWGGDLWTVPSTGGAARPITRSPARDREPKFSPDGKQIAFTSDRSGSWQAYVMPSEGGSPRQITFHTAGQSLEGWFPDGKSLLTHANRDHFWRQGDRFFRINLDQREAEHLLFDAAGDDGDLSPDGKKLLFTREGEAWWRKGYHGSQASQVWLFDLETKAIKQVVAGEFGARSPLWRPDGKGFYYVGMHKGAFNLRERELDSNADKPLTDFDDDSVVFPAISRDGSTIVFRHLFDLYRYQPGKGQPPARIEIRDPGDSDRDPIERRTLASASQVAFSKDGLEIAFIAGGDLFVMDTELREPRQITATPEEERDPVFAPEGDAILFVSDQGGQSDIWRAERGDAEKFWWLNTGFKLERLTQDPEIESDIQWSPEGSKVAYVKNRGDLWVMDPKGKDARRVVENWSGTQYDWSPDGKWFVYARDDDDFNRDIWVIPSDASKPPVNLSKHPDNEGDPVWSPDGKIIAFTGRRVETEVDIYFIWLQSEENDKASRDRSLEKALDKMKARSKKNQRGPATKGEAVAATKGEGGDEPKAEEPKPDAAKKKAPPVVAIDFDGIHERIKRVSIPNSTERGLFWSPDSKKLAFAGSIDGKAGLYTIDFPEDLKPKFVTADAGNDNRWLEQGNQIVRLVAGTPSSLAPGSAKETSYRFRALQEFNRPDRYRAAFDLAWRTMRDRYYDDRLGNRNWDAIRRKYADQAAAAPDAESLATVIQLMLGELNGSHLGFTPSAPGADPEPTPNPNPTPAPGGRAVRAGSGRWNVQTAHLGLRFDRDDKGPGLKVRDVLPGGPTDLAKSRVKAGEVVLAIDGKSVDPSMDLTQILNGPLDRDITLKIRAADGQERDVIVRPIAYNAVAGLLYDKWVKDNRAKVDEFSNGTLGYLHIRGMNMPSFYKFEEELYSAGAGKDGLIIDVRENGGGSTADLLLTALTQPLHAIAIGRGAGPGYPQDRKIFASWNKPIVVLCNQNSFSNAEIFSHAIKTLKRGKLVGVPTAGGVISTGGTTIMDLGFLRLPNRGWYVLGSGEDMELNGAVPDVVIWPEPEDWPRGSDPQIKKATEVLLQDVAAEKARPQPKLRKATERVAPRPAGAAAGGP